MAITEPLMAMRVLPTALHVVVISISDVSLVFSPLCLFNGGGPSQERLQCRELTGDSNGHAAFLFVIVDVVSTRKKREGLMSGLMWFHACIQWY